MSKQRQTGLKAIFSFPYLRENFAKKISILAKKFTKGVKKITKILREHFCENENFREY
jgi:hypothetical protein